METTRTTSSSPSTNAAQHVDADLLAHIAKAQALCTAILKSLPAAKGGAPAKPTPDSYSGPNNVPARPPRLVNLGSLSRVGASTLNFLSTLGLGAAAAIQVSPATHLEAQRAHANGYFASVDAWCDILRESHGAITDTHLAPLWPFLNELRTQRELAATWEAIKPLRDAINERGLETIGVTSKINLRGWQLEAKRFELPAHVLAAIEAGR